MMRISAFLLLLAVCAHAESPVKGSPAAVAVIPDTIVALALHSGFKLEWVMPPLETGTTAQLDASSRFDVDAHGNPWFGSGAKRYVANPKKNYAVMTDVPFSDFAFTDGGDRIVCTDGALGELESSKKAKAVEHGLPVLKFLTMLRLKNTGCRLFPGANGALYIVDHNTASGENELTLLKRVNGKLTADNMLGTKDKLAAAAGDGDVVYFAAGRGIFIMGGAYPHPKLFFKAGEDITGLAYAPDSGLFYATAGSIGFASASFNMILMKSPNPQIALRGGELYIRLNRGFGVVKLEGIARLKDLHYTKAP